RGLAASLAAGAARATNVSTDVTDIWWPDAEPGWGIQLIQNADLIFATMFMFDIENQPMFVVAVMQKQPNVDVWAGDVFGAEGTWYGLPWNPDDRFEAQVGTMSFTLHNFGMGTLT